MALTAAVAARAASGADRESAIVEGDGLRRTIGGRTVVDVDRLDVQPGEVVALLGPNGAGKSTLLRMLMLLERSDAGRVRVFGRAARVGDREARARFAAMLQQPRLFTGTVRGNVQYGLRARRVEREEARRRCDAVLEELGLGGLRDADVRTLSGGEAQRVALARALVLEPALLALDEPTAGLDVLVRNSFREALERAVRGHASACLLVTHDPAEAFLLADRIHVMESGRVVQSGSADALVAEPATPFVATFTGAELLLDGLVESLDEATVTVRLEDGMRLIAARGASVQAGSRVHVAYRPEDVVLAVPPLAGATSARNRLQLRVASLTPAGGSVRVRLDGAAQLVALVTRDAVGALGLEPGSETVALIKATALRTFAAGSWRRER